MQLIYEGVDITDSVDVVSAIVQDYAGGRADALDITMQNAEKWYAWGPKKDDRVELADSGYSTGQMYVDMILPEDGKYRIFATSMPSGARQPRWKSYENFTLKSLMCAVSAELKMDFRIYGLDENAVYPFLVRKNETGPEFMSRIVRLEGGVLKCVAGRMTAIGIGYAQKLNAARALEITSTTPGVKHTKIEGAAYAGAQIITPFGQGKAVDTTVENGISLIIQDEPAFDSVQAARWARGVLLWENRKAETLMIPMDFDAGLTAMLPVEISGEVNLAGNWLVESAEHDLINGKTAVTLLRCVTTVQ